MSWLHGEQRNPASLYYFLLALWNWWKLRPRRIACDYCGQPMWHKGVPGSEVYCSPDCAYYGPYEREAQQEPGVPF